MLESVTDQFVLVTNKTYKDERFVRRDGIPDHETLQAMSESDFELAARGAFLGWDMKQEQPASLSRSKHVAAGIFVLCAAFAVWVGLFILD